MAEEEKALCEEPGKRDKADGKGINREKTGGQWFALYTGLFLFGAAVLCGCMLLRGKLLIWQPDGLEQHYTVVGYMAKLLRGLLAGKQIPMMRFTLGQGMDVLTTCSYYGYTDPLNLLAVFANERTFGIAYVGISMLRAYLAGIAFGLYARKVGARNQWAVGCSAAIYVFSGYFLTLLGRHPYFLNGGLYLPLLLLGIERVFSDRKWLMYTLVTALMLVVNFYFAYMNTIVAIVYIVIRIIARLRERGVKQSVGDGMILMGGYLLGAAISAVVFLPIALVYLRNGRLGVQAGYSGSMLHYPMDFYVKMVTCAFVGKKGGTLFTCLSFAPLALFGVMGLFTRGKKDAARLRQLRVALYLCLIVASVPALGNVMNGMAYVTNRWIYVLSLFVALGCCFGLPRLFAANAARRLMAVLASVYALFCGVIIALKQPLYYLAGVLLLLMTAVFVFVWGGHHPWLTKRRAKRILTLMLAVTLAGNICMTYFYLGKDYVSIRGGEGPYKKVASQAKAQLIKDEGVYRVAQGAYNDGNSMLLDYMGTSYYWSLVDRSFSDYYRALWLPSLKMSYDYYGFFGNNSMNAVAAVKFFVRGEGEDYIVPYGFDLRDEGLALPNGAAAQVYENKYALPLGYTFDKRLSEAEYADMPVEDKLRALTRCAIVSDALDLKIDALDAADFAGGVVDLPYEIASTKDVELSAGKIRAEKNGTLSLTFEAPEDTVAYLLMDGLRVSQVTVGDYGRITISTADGISQDVMPAPSCNFYYQKQGSAYCLGYSALKGCDIVFSNAANYDYKDMRVIAIPLEEYREDMRRRLEEPMSDIRLSEDRIEGSISVSDERILQIAVPYSDGWSAWIDGKRSPVFRCGGLYMGVALEAGEHKLEMRYETPGLRLGALISLIAIAATVVIAIWHGMRRRSLKG